MTTSSGELDKWTSPWFALRLSADTVPWAFDRGLPFKTVASLELLATVVALVSLFPKGGGTIDRSGFVTVSGLTDSSVATHVSGRALATSYPLCLVAMEVATQMERLGVDIRLSWVPRHLNE